MYKKLSWWMHRILDITTFKLGFYETSGLYKIRPTIAAVKERNGKDLVGVEIGTYEGFNAYCMLMNLSIKKLFLVDPYLHYDVYAEDSYKRNQRYFNKIYDNAKNLLKDYKDKIEFIRLYSHEATSEIPDELDFVYIDGNHDYEFVKKDIELYYPKIKVGGIIGGHDFDGNYIGVIRAAIEFADNNNLELKSSAGDWWIVKR